MSLHQHITKTAADLRNTEWENGFFDLLLESEVYLLQDSPQQAPDGWPYMFVTSEPTSPNSEKTTIPELLEWCKVQGVGFAINPHNEWGPDYYFTYGMIWSFFEYGYFVPTDPVKSAGDLDPKKEYDIRPLNQQEFPDYVQNLLKNYFQMNGYEDPRMGFLQEKNTEHWDLAISVESLNDPEDSADFAESLGWFFPIDYSLCFIQEKYFKPLWSLKSSDNSSDTLN